MATRHWSFTINGDHFLISNARKLVSDDFVNKSFADPDAYWAREMTLEALKLMLDNSCTFGIYKPAAEKKPDAFVAKDLTQIGMARLITDYCTFAYLTDVFVQPEYQGRGLGKLLIQCAKEVVDGMPELRRVALLASEAEKTTRFYKELLGVEVFEQGTNGVVFMARQQIPFKRLPKKH